VLPSRFGAPRESSTPRTNESRVYRTRPGVRMRTDFVRPEPKPRAGSLKLLAPDDQFHARISVIALTRSLTQGAALSRSGNSVHDVRRSLTQGAALSRSGRQRARRQAQPDVVPQLPHL
jgi:hypothetical protein